MADLYFSMQLVDPSEEEYTLDFTNERPTLKCSLFIEIAQQICNSLGFLSHVTVSCWTTKLIEIFDQN